MVGLAVPLTMLQNVTTGTLFVNRFDHDTVDASGHNPTKITGLLAGVALSVNDHDANS
jgi:hypothetical protein